MKTASSPFTGRPFFRILLLVLLALAWDMPAARGGLTVDVHLYNQNGVYFAYGYLSTNADSPPPAGAIAISSPQGIYQGTTINYTSDGASLTWGGGGGWAFGDYPSFITWLTNGAWTIGITNGPNTNLLYTFTVTATDIPASDFTSFAISYPFNGEENVSDLPTFAWEGPTNWDGAVIVYIQTTVPNGNTPSAILPGTETIWPSSQLLSNGSNTFNVTYISNATDFIVASTPVESASQAALPDWVSTATMEVDASSAFFVGTAPSIGVAALPAGHTNVGHYTFDSFVPASDMGYPTELCKDFSQYGNNFPGFNNWGPPPYQYPQPSADAMEGGQAIEFFGTSAMEDQNLTDPTYSNLVTALSGSFTVSCWLKTTNSLGNNSDDPTTGMGVLWDYNNGTDDTIPISITGSNVAFFTGDASGIGDTLYSSANVVTGAYVHIAVTRNQADGTKTIYINGVLDQSDVGTTDILDGNTNNPYLSVGGPPGYVGLLDDLQIYSGVLNSNEIAYIYHHPGVAVPDQVAVPPGETVVAHYTFDNAANPGADSSGNGYDLNYNGNPQGGGVVFSADAESGGGAASFDGGSFFSYTTAPPAVLAALAGDFTISLWVKTTQSFDFDGDYAFNGAGVVAADVPGLANDLVPIALTGGGIGFNTGGSWDDTLSSSADINDGNYHQVAVTRIQATGEKRIYIDGQWNESDFASAGLLNDPQLLAIGAQIDASQSNPANASPQNFYQGLIDDIQIYSNALSSSQIAYLYNNPGSTLSSNASVAPPVPVSVALGLDIWRVRDPVVGDYYTAGPWFGSVSPSPITTNWVISPNGYFFGETYPSGGSTTSYGISTLDEVLNECTNGLWTLYINKGDPSQQTFTFSVTVTNLTTNLLAPVNILIPTNGATNVPSNTPFGWTGPGNFSSISVHTQRPDGSDIVNANLAVTATNWPSPPAQGIGTNQIFVTYESNNFPGLSFSTPVNASGSPVASWSPVVVDLYSTSTSQFIVTPAAAAARLTNWACNGAYLQFAYQSQSNFMASVQYTTNLASTNWNTYTSILGNGLMQVVQLPLSLFGASKAGYVRVSTAGSQTVVAPTANPVTLTNVLGNGTYLQFSYLSQSNFSALVQYTTNLASTNWNTYSNVPGNGSIQVIQLPLSLFGASRAGYVRVHP